MAIEFPTLAALLNSAVGSAVDCTLHKPSACRIPAGNRVVPRAYDLVPFRDGVFCAICPEGERRACTSGHPTGNGHRAVRPRDDCEAKDCVQRLPVRDGHACMSRGRRERRYRQAGRDRDEAKRNRGVCQTGTQSERGRIGWPRPTGRKRNLGLIRERSKR